MKCDCYHEEYGRTVCYGTKEREVCSCRGERSNCDFYSTVRAQATSSKENSRDSSDLFKKTLIISPHFDDETIGCGGLITSLVSRGEEIKIVIVATSDVYNISAGRLVKNEERKEECCQALQELGISDPEDILVHLEGFFDGRLDNCDKQSLVTALDSIIQEYKPTAVLFPYSSHHQDHQAVYQASISALRPMISTRFIKLKAAYEYPYITTSWNSNMRSDSKIYYTLTEEEINNKKRALQSYKSQLDRDRRDILSVESIINLAKVRGTEIGKNWAEAFYPISIIVR